MALHGGQAATSTRNFFALSAEEQSTVEAFLKSLVAPSSAATPGVVLAAELESRLEPDVIRDAEAISRRRAQTEVLVRKQREEALALQQAQTAETRRQQFAATAAKIAPGRFRMAMNLEKVGKSKGAIELYRKLVRDVPDRAEGRMAAERIKAILDQQSSPQSQ